MGLLPILDILPFYVAEQKGYFEAEGIKVEFVPVKSAQERDALMQAGEIDGMLNDLISTGLFNRDNAQIKIVSTARRAYPESSQFRVLAAPDSNLNTTRDLAGVPIGISQNTIIEYITDRLLEAEGLTPEQIEIVEVSAIPVRFEQLMASQIQAATLPDPLAQGAMAAGATLVVDDSRYTQYFPERAQLQHRCHRVQAQHHPKIPHGVESGRERLEQQPWPILGFIDREGAGAGEHTRSLPDASLPRR